MRYNKFGEAYCHTAEEARSYIDDKSDGEVYVSHIEPPEGDDKATAEVLENESGDTVCYIEADTEAAVRKIIEEAGIECQA